MITRRTNARQLEEQLKHTLLGLNISRASCEQLLQEREDSEKEMSSVSDKNKQMRREFVELHSQLMDTREKKNQLQRTVDRFDRSSGALEDALKLTTDLNCDCETPPVDDSRPECDSLAPRVRAGRCVVALGSRLLVTRGSIRKWPKYYNV
ncbi:hypothetical protein EVAR_5600_1 [Eumeta japonica]|uniref:Uncharacterized protein n=1 Tax=Eumeta variegata TaxID=151549 RepID=A0A4C1U1K5_EUMVA|nr:hypothetical protein EVAR_5600_1 [Eumeta japonica]